MTRGVGPLAGLRVLEIAGLGPAPFCAMLLADLGADVVLVDRMVANSENVDLGAAAITNRGKRSIAVNLKDPAGIATVLDLAAVSDVLIEGMRPGVMERLGLGPDACLERNPALVYGRMTGWGQDGPLSQAAGHDLNYIGLSGALWFAGQPGEPPLAPPSLVGDIGGGALYLAVGVLAAAMSARQSGKGQVVDAAIVDGSAHMTSLLLSLLAGGAMEIDRGRSGLDGAPWYGSYRCADGGFITLGSVEPKFYRQLLEKLGLLDDPAFLDRDNLDRWPDLRERLTVQFATRTRSEWCTLLEGTDVCFAPALDPIEAAAHPHMAARQVYREVDGVLQAAPAPRFSGTPAQVIGSVPARGADMANVRADWLGQG
jgi:acetyl-CoA hydrolase